MRIVVFAETLPASTRLTLFSDDKPDPFFTVTKFGMDATSGVALDLKTGVPTYQIEDEEGTTHLIIHLPIQEQTEYRWCLWRPEWVMVVFVSRRGTWIVAQEYDQRGRSRFVDSQPRKQNSGAMTRAPSL
jgi:hypothetical protein